MLKIKGRYIEPYKETIYTEWTVEEIAQFIKDGHAGRILLSGYYMGDISEETHASASSLDLFPNETIPRLEDGKIVVSTAFRSYKLPYKYQTANPDELIKIDCFIDIDDEELFVSISKYI